MSATDGHGDLRQEMREIEALETALNEDCTQAELDVWSGRQGTLLDKIEALDCTPANARIKAEAVAHIYFSSDLLCDNDDTTDNRLARQVIRCLIGGAE